MAHKSSGHSLRSQKQPPVISSPVETGSGVFFDYGLPVIGKLHPQSLSPMSWKANDKTNNPRMATLVSKEHS